MDTKLIPFSKKKKRLGELNEAEFRDQIVRPLFLRKGFIHGEEMCGPDEEGKDCYFTIVDGLGVEMIYAVQTKCGNLSMASEPKKNVQIAITQMHTLMAAMITNTNTNVKKKPNVGIFCTNGKINQAARKHIADEVNEQNLRFMDLDDIIPDIDKNYPEFWLGIGADRHPYLESLHQRLVDAKDVISLTNILSDAEKVPLVTEEGFANIRLSRTSYVRRKVSGKIIREPKFREISATTIVRRAKKRFLIKGDAGFGKSTLLRRIAEIQIQNAFKSSDEDLPIPVLIRSNTIDASPKSVAEVAMDETVATNTVTNEPAFDVNDLEKGRVMLLVDALDEAATDDRKAHVVKKLKEFTDLYPECVVVVTTRDSPFIGKSTFLTSFEHWNILPLALKEARKIIDCAANNRAIPNEVKSEVLRQLNRIHGIDLNPLLVTVLVATTDGTKKDIPANITELFSKFTEMMLGRWDSKKGFSQQFESGLKHRLLGQLALKLHKKKQVCIPRLECEIFLKKELEELMDSPPRVDLLMTEILDRSGLFRQTPEGIEFRHLLLQEYFAGTAISGGEHFRSCAGDEWWRRVVVFYFGSNPGESQELQELALDAPQANDEEKFCAAVTIGLAVQACYFVKIPDRIEILKIVAQSLAECRELYDVQEDSHSLHTLLYYYLTGRDALASDLVTKIKISNKGFERQEFEHYLFWIAAGMIESGNIVDVEQLLKKHKLQSRLSLGLHLGAFTVQHGKFATPEVRKAGARLCSKLEPHVSALRKQFLDEFKSLMFEIRGGEIIEAEIIETS